jgi:hypothetical protein
MMDGSLVSLTDFKRDISYLSKALPAPLIPHGFHGHTVLHEAARLSDTTILTALLQEDVSEVYIYGYK